MLLSPAAHQPGNNQMQQTLFENPFPSISNASIVTGLAQILHVNDNSCTAQIGSQDGGCV